MTVATISATRLSTVTRRAVLEGIRPIMFDRYAGDNNTRLSWQEKIYLAPGTNQLVLPVANINSFFTAHNTNSAPKRLRDKRKYKDLCNALQSFMLISGTAGGEYIPFLREGEPITVGDFEGEDGADEKSGLHLHRSVARLDKGIPNPKERPVLPLPWSLEFQLTLIKNDYVKESDVKNLASEGGIAIGLGTYRGVYGKFLVSEWADS